ncbi:MAG: hypothetical protein COB23_03245 [Methylophaga sp.]|nr:MAG: hypothetical protein COB23_03245 [Methylophaga sp.]
MFNLLIPAVTVLLDKLIPDPQAKAEAQIKLIELSQSGQLKELESAMTVIAAEAKSEHWIVAAWRPITMLSFVAIIVNNYLIYPYLSLFWSAAPLLVLPPDLWALLKIGLGGYVIGRSVEKGIDKWKN